MSWTFENTCHFTPSCPSAAHVKSRNKLKRNYFSAIGKEQLSLASFWMFLKIWGQEVDAHQLTQKVRKVCFIPISRVYLWQFIMLVSSLPLFMLIVHIRFSRQLKRHIFPLTVGRDPGTWFLLTIFDVVFFPWFPFVFFSLFLLVLYLFFLVPSSSRFSWLLLPALFFYLWHN